jgi:hypothetical protein
LPKTISFAQAGRLLGVHRGTLCRWASRGLDGVYLQRVQEGRPRTTREAIAAFVTECRARGVRGIAPEVAARAEDLLP